MGAKPDGRRDGKRVGLLAGLLLVLVLGTGVVAESPSPPPWSGGRVGMSEYGFAVTVPDDWLYAEATGVPDAWWDQDLGAPEEQREAFVERGGVFIARNAIGTSPVDEYCRVELWSASSLRDMSTISMTPRAVT